VEVRLFAGLSLLKQGGDLEGRMLYELDPATGEVQYYDGETALGKDRAGATAVLLDGKALIRPRSGEAVRTVELGPEVKADPPLRFAYLLKAPGIEAGAEKVYSVLDLNAGEVRTLRFKALGREKLSVDGEEKECAAFAWSREGTGAQGRLWIGCDDGVLMRREEPEGVTIRRAGAEEVNRVKAAQRDPLSFAPVALPNVRWGLLTYMKVKARIRTEGGRISAESLNIFDQRFEGTVDHGVVDGIFESAPRRYMGEGVPPFPAPDFRAIEILRPYLDPERLIESEDPAVREKAAELTAGSRHLWDAATRLSAWVADQAAFSLADGSARETLRSLEGDSEAQSRLFAALCRATGIPARVVLGCMYSPLFGGSLATQAWCEIYLGEAGWVAVDVAAGEVDYIDASHIRLGEVLSVGLEQAEVLDHVAAGRREIERPAVETFGEVSWSEGREATFEYNFMNRALGTETYRVMGVEGADGAPMITCATRLQVEGRAFEGEWKMTPGGAPLYYRNGGKGGERDYEGECFFTQESVLQKIRQSDKRFTRTVPLGGPVLLIDNNNLSLWDFLVAGLDLADGAKFRFQVFHPSSMEVLPLTLSVVRAEPILWNGENIDCRVLEASLDGYPLKLWVDEKRRILRESEQNGRTLIERR